MAGPRRFPVCGAVFFLLSLTLGLRAAPPAASTAPAQDDLPQPIAPTRFNPDPGGRDAAETNTVVAPAGAPPALPSLFEPVLPPPPPLPVGGQTGEKPLPYKLQLPREGVIPTALITAPLPYPQYQLSEGGIGLLPNEIPEYNRWRIPFGQYNRYADPNLETPYQAGPLRLFDPYKVSKFKGDTPIIGNDIFLSVTFEDQQTDEFRRVPTGAGISTARSESTDFFGRSESYTISNNLSATIELFKGETSFKPIDWAIRITPIFNINFTDVSENGVVSPDPRGPNFGSPPKQPGQVIVTEPGTIGGLIGNDFNHVKDGDDSSTRYTRRTRETVSLEEAFVEIHLKDLDNNYDFISTRIGSQLLNADFRGFVFNDTNTGLRFFGNYDNNRLQYNAAYFNMREKDTFSGLNQYSSRGQDVLVANVFRQDALQTFLSPTNNLAQGYTVELSFLADLDHGEQHFDKNGFIVRPAAVGGPIEEHGINAFYFGLNGDGHIGWLNITNSFYEVVGHDVLNGIAGRGVDINAQQFALELSRDFDYLRPKFSFLYASGDSNAKNGTATGFDSILDNPTFIGSPFSYYARQGVGLANSNVLLKGDNTLLMDLRSSKEEGQANFVNPGTIIVGTGLDADLTPKLRMQFNANYIRMVNPDSVKTVLFTNNVDRELGYDISLGFTYRPTLTNNIIINAGLGVMLPGTGYRDIYRELTRPVPGFTPDPKGEIDSVLYSGLIAITLTY